MTALVVSWSVLFLRHSDRHPLVMTVSFANGHSSASAPRRDILCSQQLCWRFIRLFNALTERYVSCLQKTHSSEDAPKGRRSGVPSRAYRLSFGPSVRAEPRLENPSRSTKAIRTPTTGYRERFTAGPFAIFNHYLTACFLDTRLLNPVWQVPLYIPWLLS